MSVETSLETVPGGWVEYELSDLVDLKSGFAYKSRDWVNDGVPVIKIANVRNGRVDVDGCSYITEEIANATLSFCVSFGDLLMTLTGEIGAIGVYKESSSARLNQRVARIDIKSSSDILFDFLCLFLESPSARQFLWSKAQGMAQPNISPKEVLSLLIQVPPLKEQEKVVEILEEQLSRLDAALASVSAVREKSARFCRSLLHAAFTGALTGRDSSSEGAIPEGWNYQELVEAAEVIMGQSPPGTSYNEDGVGLPFFQGKAEFGFLHPSVRKWTTAGTKHALAGDILMSVRAPVGPTNVADINCVIGRGLAAIRARRHVNQTYLLWILRSFEQEIASKGTGTTFDSISGDALRSQMINVPPLDEQNKIVEILEEQLSRLDASLAVANAIEKKASDMRRSLLHAAFTGELTKEWREGAHV
jgi:restriction endonuclease S subunit